MITISDPTPAEIDVVAYRRMYWTHWRDMDEHYWMERLMQEIGELAGTLAGDHPDPTELELIQIASICINWLAMRRGER